MVAMSSTASTSSSVVSTVGPKTSKLVAKSGFVIPKNKLSGSLVPVSRGGKKAGGAGLTSEESVDPTQRKSRWGPDLCLDTSVRKGRAVAYQTRVNQITEQLQNETLDTEGNEGMSDADKPCRVDSTVSQLLELERRETIGEILRLNPSFKPPLDYKPLLKEARIRIPVKEQTSYHLLELIFGPKNETLKKLELETGSKMQVFGTKSESLEEVEIARTDMVPSDSTYKELSISIAAETFEKVDAAVSLIELLVISLMENLAKGEQSFEMPMSKVSSHDSDQAPDQFLHRDQPGNQGSWIQLAASHGSQTTQTLPPMFGTQPTQPLAHSISQAPFQPPRNYYGAPLSAETGMVDFPPNQRPPVPTFQHSSNLHQGPLQDQQYGPSGSSSVWPAASHFPMPSQMQIAAPTAPHQEFSNGYRHTPIPGFPSYKEPLIGSNMAVPIPLPPGPSVMTMVGSHTGPAGEASRFTRDTRPIPFLSFPGNHDSASDFRPPMVGEFRPASAGFQYRLPAFNSLGGAWNSRPPPSFRSGMPNIHMGGQIPAGPQGNQLNMAPALMVNNGARFPPRIPPFSSPVGNLHVPMQPRPFAHMQPPSPHDRPYLPPKSQWLGRGTVPQSSARPNDQFNNAKGPGPGGPQVYDPFSPTSVATELQSGTKSEREVVPNSISAVFEDVSRLD